jgi:peptide/nickel transport system permease protein
MSARGLQYLLQEWWVPVMPGIAIFLLALSANLAGDGLRELMSSE